MARQQKEVGTYIEEINDLIESGDIDKREALETLLEEAESWRMQLIEMGDEDGDDSD